MHEALGVRASSPDEDREHLYGWSDSLQLHLQHATPQQMLDLGLISRENWASYHKVVSVRNPWDRACSDYYWMMNDRSVIGSFEQYFHATGPFRQSLTELGLFYRGDHLREQRDYLELDGRPITFNRVLRFERLTEDFSALAADLNLPANTFTLKHNRSPFKLKHYSMFYDEPRAQLVSQRYAADVARLGYRFEDRKTTWDRQMARWPRLTGSGQLQLWRIRLARSYALAARTRRALR